MRKGQRPAHAGRNHRNETSAKTVVTRGRPDPAGSLSPDRRGEFQPQIIPKHARRVEGFNEAIVSLCQGLTTGEIRTHLAGIYGVDVSRGPISRSPTG